MAQALVCGPGTLQRLSGVVRDLGLHHVLLVADAGIRAAGYVDAASRILTDAGIAVAHFDQFGENPTSDMIEAGRAHAAPLGVDGIIGLGGGSSLDCAKGINFVLSNGGTMADYRGYGKATRALLPMVGIPTTAGTGSEAQSYAIISDPHTHEKMACGDPGAAFRAVILDPVLTATQPAPVTAAAGYDALSHAVETWVTRVRNPVSDLFAREAWTKLSGNYERVLSHPSDLAAREAMLLGAHLAGAAIERSMLGATHACANALTAHRGTIHGVAIAILLRHVVRWNGGRDVAVAARYAQLDADLAGRLGALAAAGGFPAGVAATGATRDAMDVLTAIASRQWTGTFNPVPFGADAAREIFDAAWVAA